MTFRTEIFVWSPDELPLSAQPMIIQRPFRPTAFLPQLVRELGNCLCQTDLAGRELSAKHCPVWECRVIALFCEDS